MSVNQIKKLLDSRFDQEILDGLKRVITMMHRGQPCLPFFSNIIKNVASPNVEVKKLVYIYLLQHAEQEPDLALLSINTIQKTLSDQSPQVRAMALRVMSGIRVPIISQIVSLAIKKGCGDMSALVRRTAAAAIPKCYRLEPSTEPQLVDYISQLLGDKQYYVVGAAVVAFLEVCPDRIDLIHKHYRSLVKKMVDMDEWGQNALIRLLTVYARKCFPREPSDTREHNKADEKDRPDDTSTTLGETSQPDNTGETLGETPEPDLVLFLNACKTLLQSRNPATILAVVRAYRYVGTKPYLEAAVKPLTGLLRGPSDQHAIVIYNIVSICLDYPTFFAPFIDKFWLRSTDSQEVWRLKMEILTLVFPYCDTSRKGLILSELEHFTTTSEANMTRESVQAIGRCAQNDASTTTWCLDLLLRQTSSPDDHLVGEALTVVRHLIQQDPTRHRKTIIRLAKGLDSIYNAQARATIVWLVGEYAASGSEDETVAPDVLRILARGFVQEEEPVKSQILLLGAKVYLNYLNHVTPAQDIPGKTEAEEAEAQQSEAQQSPNEQESSSPQKQGPDVEHAVSKLWEYILLLIRYDTSFELRDRARLYRNLLADVSTLQLANLVLLAPKPVPQVPSPSETRRKFLLGSASLVIGQDVGPSGLTGYEPIPDWVKPGDEPDSSLRDTMAAADVGSGQAPAAAMLDSAVEERVAEMKAKPKVAQKSLNDWLDEDDGTADQVSVSRPNREASSGEETEETEETDSDEDEDSEDEASNESSE